MVFIVFVFAVVGSPYLWVEVFGNTRKPEFDLLCFVQEFSIVLKDLGSFFTSIPQGILLMLWPQIGTYLVAKDAHSLCRLALCALSSHKLLERLSFRHEVQREKVVQ